jgi:starvation-inducible DNA-binding protein
VEQAYSQITRPAAPLAPSGFQALDVKDISRALTMVLADVFALYLKTKNFHWHLPNPNYRHYRRMLGEQGLQLFDMTDPLAERTRKIGGTTLRSISHIARLQRILDSDSQYVVPHEMLTELCEDNIQLLASMRAAHSLCDEYGDVATAGLLKNWIDCAEERVWFLFEAGRDKTRDEQE